MPQFLKKFIVIAVLALSTLPSMGFSLLGVPEPWQTPALGYDPLGNDIGAPKNLGEEYRWTTPIITYGFDQSFINYFGVPGMRAIEEAIKIYNDLPAFSTINMTNQFPVLDEDGNPTHWANSRHENGLALGLNLVDLKSVAMGLLIEELGLAAPERWVWALRDRKLIGTPPITNYLVIQRNFDPATYEPSFHVNGVRYTYGIFEFDTPTFADAVELNPTDPLIPPYNTVAGLYGNIIAAGADNGLNAGVYYTGLTRDDIGGLKYIYQKNNINQETFPPNTFIFAPDRTNIISITNQPLILLSMLSSISTPSQISNFFPGIVVSNSVRTGSGPILEEVITTNTITIGLFTNRSQLVLLTNEDLAAFSSLTRTSEPAALPAGLDIISTNLVGLTTQVQIASIGLTNLIGPVFTNRTNLTILTNQDLYVLSRTSLTSSPAIMAQLFPEIIITNFFNSVRTIVEPFNVYVTNAPRQPWEVPVVQPNFILATNYVTNLQTLYFYSYANVITNYVSPITTLTHFRSGFEREPWSVPNNPVYKTNFTTVVTNEISGAYTVIPLSTPNVIGYELAGFTSTNLFRQTNFLFVSNLVDNISGTIRNLRATETTFFTNLQYAAYPIQLATVAQQVLVTNLVTNIVRLFDYRFRNVITNFSSPTATVTIQDVTVQQDLFRPTFPPVTNIVSRTVLTNFLNGSILRFASNLFGVEFSGLALTNIVTVTNILIDAVNPNTGLTFQRLLIYPHTNIIYGVYPIEFLPQGFVTNILTTNLVSTTVDFFSYQFANVITNPPPFRAPSGNSAARGETITNYVYRISLDGSGNLQTNLVSASIQFVPLPTGSFLIDTNFSGYEFSGISTTNIISATNSIRSLSDVNVFTNIVYRFTNIAYSVFPFTLQPAVGNYLRPGIDEIQFVRVGPTNLTSFDYSYTNRFTASYITNGGLVTSTFVVTNTQPDILFSAADLGVFNNSVFPVQTFRTANMVNLNPGTGALAQGGPGIIVPRVDIIFNKVGPSYLNTFPGNVREDDLRFTRFRPFVWGSFDGDAEPPIVFPKDITLEQIELKVLNQQP